jgi:hypothetical protein
MHILIMTIRQEWKVSEFDLMRAEKDCKAIINQQCLSLAHMDVYYAPLSSLD